MRGFLVKEAAPLKRNGPENTPERIAKKKPIYIKLHDREQFSAADELIFSRPTVFCAKLCKKLMKGRSKMLSRLCF